MPFARENSVRYVLGAVLTAFALIGGGALLMCAGCVTAAGRGAQALSAALGPSPLGIDSAEEDEEPETPTKPGVFPARLVASRFRESLETDANGHRAMRRMLAISLPGDRDVKGLFGTASIFAADGRVLWRGPIRIREEVSERQHLYTFVEIPYDDRNAAHRDLRAATEDLEGEVRATRVEYADGTAETFKH